MQKQFRYIYNNEEVSREEFERLAGDSFKWFDGDSIVSVPFSSFDSFFTGDFKSRRQINDHLDSVLNIYQNKVTEDIINKPKCSPQCFCDGSCKKDLNITLEKPTIDCRFTMCGQKGCACCYPQEKNTNSTRHKSQAGETHIFKTNVEQREKLELLRQYLLNQPSVQNDVQKITKLFLSETEEELKSMISAEKIKTEEKDDVIINSNRGEKETMEYLQGVKESQSVDKAPIFTYCKVNKNALEALSLRALYGHKKYKETDQDWQNFTRVPNALEEYANASFRHALGIGEEDEETHLVAEAWNAVAKLEVFLRDKLNKS